MEQNCVDLTDKLSQLFVTFTKVDMKLSLQKLKEISDPIQRAITTIIELLNLGMEHEILRHQLALGFMSYTIQLLQYDDIKAGVRAWRNEKQQNILFLVPRVCCRSFEYMK